MQTTDIESLIPQRPPILMVNRFECDSADGCTTWLDVSESNMFMHDGHLLAEGLIEHIAQTAAAYIGYRRREVGDDVNLGFIGDVKKCTVAQSLPRPGDTVETRMRVVSQVGAITMIAAESTVQGETVTSCRMKLAN